MASDNGTLLETRQGQTVTSLPGINNVGVLGFDWLTDTLYWTNSKLNTVCSIFSINFADKINNWQYELHCLNLEFLTAVLFTQWTLCQILVYFIAVFTATIYRQDDTFVSAISVMFSDKLSSHFCHMFT